MLAVHTVHPQLLWEVVSLLLRTTTDRSLVRPLQKHLQKKDHISIYRVVAFLKGTEILHVFWLLWLFTMTDNSKVPDWTHWALIWLLSSHFRGKKVWQFKEMKKGVWKKHLKISAPGIKALCLEVSTERIRRAPSTDAEENEPFVYKAFVFLFLLLRQVVGGFLNADFNLDFDCHWQDILTIDSPC